MIYESEAWVKAINEEPFKSLPNRIYETVKRIYENILNRDNVIDIDKRNEKILFHYDKNEKRLSLLNLLKEDAIQAFDIEGRVSEWKQSLINNISIVKRAYPQYILADEDLWMDIENDPQSNFMLSKEEIDVLDACSKESAFPLFINGRAGSGKSTMLQYLFADFFSRYISYKETFTYPPAYFTYNSELLQRVKLFVKGLITCNPAFNAVQTEAKENNEIISKLDNSFKELKTYLLSIVPEPDRNKFERVNYVGYTRFKELWFEKFKTDRKAKEAYSPDLSWHVMRTYIQGMDIDGLMEPEDYDDLEEKQKSVSRESYQTIYDKVWRWYSELKQEKNLWDDQDLVRYILGNDIAKPVFPGIFCDEAQDFTRIEMEVIFRMSLYSNRDIQKQNISRIPFAFAGDELQTLNPTGFRWEALKAGFTQKFILSLSSERRDSTINLNYRVLENNYRSLPFIVKFCNTLQLFRAVRFDISGLRPQKFWNNSPSHNPVAYFLAGNTEFWGKIQKLTDTVFIIPCDEGDEVEWIKKDKILNQYITIENNAPKNIRVLSANLAKGLEFNRVVVYGFGDKCPPHMIEKAAGEDMSITLPLEYYINKTYVAVSRAKTQLLIVDTEEGIRNLWDVTIKKEHIDHYLEIINEGNTKSWSLDNDLFQLAPGYSSLLDNAETNTEDLASQFMQYGISTKSAYMLRQAADSYKTLGNNVEARKCGAIAYLFDKKYFEAGKEFNDSGRTAEAIKSFWLSNSPEGYKEIIRLTQKIPSYKYFYDVALSMSSKDKADVLKAINAVAQASSEALYNIFKGDEIFADYDMRDVLNSAINAIAKKALLLITPDTGDNTILYNFINIANQGIRLEPAHIAEIAYTLNVYEKAIEFWDKTTENIDKEKYNRAKAYCTEFPENLSLLKSIGEYSEIVSQYNVSTGKLSEDQLCIVAEAFFEQKDIENTLEACTNITNPEKFDQLYKHCSSGRGEKRLLDIILILKKISTIREEKWNDIWKLIQNEKNTQIKSNIPIAIYFACALARTGSLCTLAERNGSAPNKKDVSEYLREEVIKKYTRKSPAAIPNELVLDIGTAIEMAGRRIDALEYYEFMESNLKKEDIKIKCIERWIKVKERQAEIDEEMSERRINEALDKRKSYHISEKATFPEYEDLSPWLDLYKFIVKNEMTAKKDENVGTGKDIAGVKQNSPKIKVVQVEKQDGRDAAGESTLPQLPNFEFEFNGYKFAFYYQNNRLNISSKTDGKTISITENNYFSNDYSVEEIQFDGVCQSIKDTSILFKNEDKIKIFFKDIKLEVGFNTGF